MGTVTVARLPRQLGSTGLPRTCEVELSYATDLALQCATFNALSYYQWNLGDLFDPDRTVAGQQWYLRDQFATLYSTYKAVKFEVIFKVACYAVNTGEGIHLSLGPKYDASTPASHQLMACLPLGEYHPIPTNAPATIFKREYTPWEILGITRSQWMNDNSYNTAVGSSPSAQQIMTIAYSAWSGNQPILAGQVMLRTTFVLFNQVYQTMS